MSDDEKTALPDHLARAYAVKSPDDSRALYADWAGSYEADMVAPHGYVAPETVADILAAACADHGAATLDVGCGTGLVGVALARRGFTAIDGVDISPQMLAEAGAKRVYRELIEADLSRPLARRGPRGADGVEADGWGAITSVGCFTHGHLGPEVLTALAGRLARGGVMAVGINADLWEGAGFAAAVDALAATGELTLERVEDAMAVEATGLSYRVPVLRRAA